MNHATFTTLSLCAGFALAATAVADTLHVPSQYASIQDAIDAAQDGDDIVVGPGTYQESVDIGSRSVNLLSSDGPESTFLEPGSAHDQYIVLVGDTNTPVVHIEGFTLRNHYASYQGALAVYDSEILVRNCHFTNCINHYGGPAIRLAFYGYGDDMSNAMIENCRFEGNEALASTGAYGGAVNGGLGPDALVHLAQCQFLDNTAANGGHAAFFAMGGSPTALMLDGCSMEGGHAGNQGGAVYLSGTGSTSENWVHAGFCEFRNNHAAGTNTAALHLGPSMNLDMHETLVSGSHPGGLWISPESTAELQDNEFCSNTAFDIQGEWVDWGNNSLSPSCSCTGDTDGDGSVTVNDLLNLLAAFGGTDASYDLDESGQVDVGDVLIIIASWGECG